MIGGYVIYNLFSASEIAYQYVIKKKKKTNQHSEKAATEGRR